MHRLIDSVDGCLAQTQCQRCGYASCRAYAKAIVEDGEAINRCPPGGEKTLASLAKLLQREAVELNPECGEFSGFKLALIDEQWCIGCTVCIQKCPLDAIVGASQRMHTVVTGLCSGCELCVEPCPTGCISMVEPAQHPATHASVISWSQHRQEGAKRRYASRESRLQRHQAQNKEAKHRRRLRRSNLTDKQNAIEAALTRVGLNQS